MKVLHVIASTSKFRGGTSTAVANCAMALERLGIHSDIATTDDDGPQKHLDVPLGEFVASAQFRTIYFKKQSDFYSACLPMLAWLRRYTSDYDVVHAHGLFNFAPFAASWSARRAGCPMVLTPHGTLDRWGREHRRPLLKNLSIKLVDSRIIKSAAMVHFTSSLERDQALEISHAFNSCVIPLGIDCSPVTELASVSRPADLPDDIGTRPTILFFSRIDLMKGLDVLLGALSIVLEEIPSAVLAIAGDGPPDFVASLKQRSSLLGIATNIHWLGFVTGAKKAWLLHNCHVFVLPSQSENFGLSVVEAMACGLPVVVSPGVGLAELVKLHGAGAVCEANEDQLAETLVDWLKHPEKLRAAGSVGKSLAQKEMSLDVFGERLSRLYSSLVAPQSTTSCLAEQK